MEISSHGLTYCSCVIVEFPDSPVQLDGLPQGYFPIVPVTWSFSTSFVRDNDGQHEQIKLSRHQLVPIQPGFAITGHSAQGKTLPKVLVGLHEGGFAAYVAASRAKSRTGLCITEPVHLQNLNKPLPYDLFVEVQRLEKLEHNTLVRHGFINGTVLSTPDPESESNQKLITMKSQLIEPTAHKRKFVDNPNANIFSPSHSSPEAKRRKKALSNAQLMKPASNGVLHPQAATSSISASTFLTSAGCRWSAVNWSCAYDSVFMSLYGIYTTAGFQLRQIFRSASPLANILDESFRSLLESPLHTTTMFNNHRDNLRNELSSRYPDQFQRFGQHGTAASAILDVLFPSSGRQLMFIPHCPNGCTVSTHLVDDAGLPTLVVPSELVHNSFSTTMPNNLNQYLSNFFHRTSHDLTLLNMCCAECNMSFLSFSSSFINTPPVLFLEVPMQPESTLSGVLPSWFIEVPSSSQNSSYQLSAIIYLGDFHFTSRLISEDGSVWKYDGQLNNGVPVFEFSAHRSESELLHFLSFNSRKAHIYIYCLMHTDR